MKAFLLTAVGAFILFEDLTLALFPSKIKNIFQSIGRIKNVNLIIRSIKK